MKEFRPDYSKDPDFEGYLYLYDADIIEEEMHFEEMLMMKELSQVQSDEVDKKK